ncbi:MAG: PDZ domain-containing protein [Prevotellaceae bacterium]|jgi:tricorn protease|nr:PDZ domain-containing protein [Prevotellaceae bacterium]
MKKIFFISLLLFCLSAQAEDEARLLRFPATNGADLVFTYAGDLYTAPLAGGVARKLTSHVGFEMFPHFSPDGRTIAFTGQYDGNTEVFTIPAEGGTPLRITYTATLGRDDVSDRMGPNNIVTAWTPDGRHIIYRSRKQTFGFRGHLFSVPAGGGLSTQVPLPEGGFCSFSPDGKKLAYNRVFREFRTWKYYKGGMADDVWIHDFDTRTTTNITQNDAQDIFPMWIGNEIFFISDRDRTMNLFVYNLTTGQTEKVTDFTDYDIKFPSVSGDDIVFENGGYIYHFNAKTRKTGKVDIRLSDDFNYARTEWKDVSTYITATSLSPNGERLAVTARGDVYNVPATEGVTRQVTASPGAHERNAQWSPDGQWIAYISDKTGETELYLQKPGDHDAIQLTANNDSYISSFAFSPDSKHIVYADRKSRIRYVHLDSKQVVDVAHDTRGLVRLADWSPDSKWLAYSLRASNDMDVIYLYNLTDKKHYPVTDKWYDSGRPMFSSDGKYLYFVSSRDFNPTYGRNEWNFVYNNMSRVYMAILSKDTPSPLAAKDDKVETDASKEDNGKEKPEDKKGKKDKDSKTDTKKTDVKIDPDGISERIVGLPVSPGEYYLVYATADKVYYSTYRNLKVYDLKAQKETELGDNMSLSFSPNGKKALVRSNRSLYVIDAPSGKITLSKSVDLSGMKTQVNYAEEWAQIFNESWRHFRDGFYVPNMHGVDWKAMRDKYAVLLPYVKHRADLTYIIGEMIGELNIGHAYVNSGEMPRPNRTSTGLLGAQISRHESGYFRIDSILPGANWDRSLYSPLTEIGVNAKKGAYITAIDGKSTQGVNDLYSLLAGKAGKKVALTLHAQPAKGGREVIVTPVADESQLYYYNWVQDNIRKVNEATQGRVGYIHIPDMGVPGLNEFAKYFYPQLDKEGLIIDDRSNGGGNVSPMLLERLARVPYRATMYRTSEHPGAVPGQTHVGPKVTLIDKYSMSDGDLFPHGFRELGLGKLIGVRTWGGIVGISGSLPFIDGADLRIPFFTSYSIETGDWIIEGQGVEPDITVDNDPAKEWDGEDEQLNRAIEELLKELAHRKGIPPIPPGPDKSK